MPPPPGIAKLYSQSFCIEVWEEVLNTIDEVSFSDDVAEHHLKRGMKRIITYN